MNNTNRIHQAFACGCKPYVDVFTYNRWQTQGYQVRLGEHGIKIPIIRDGQAPDDNQQPVTRRLIRQTTVFCRHQVSQTAPTPVHYQTPKAPAVLPAGATIEGVSIVANIMSTWREI